METIVIFGSSRSDGNTKAAVEAVINQREVEIVDLAEKNISYYDYQNRNQDDDFLKIAEKMVQAQVIIFATPVYWYSMSAQLKTFFDRFSDLITIRKDLGRALKGKICYAITTGADVEIPAGLLESLQRTAEYLDMDFKGAFYYKAENGKEMSQEALRSAQAFGNKIFE